MSKGITPVRSCLDPKSLLLAKVQAGLDAVEKSHRARIDGQLRSRFLDSLEVDSNLQAGREQENRWDYLLGFEDGAVIGLESHSAHTSEVKTVINKKRAAQRQLAEHLGQGKRISAWVWVASGKVDFVPHEKAILRLAGEGITFAGETLKLKHLPKK